MEKDIAVKIEGIGKKYVIGDSEKYLALRDILVKAIKAPINILKGKGFKKKKEFWALKDINLDVERGDVVGIIGRNGAGKSTLLKILSRITEPTEGSIKYHGKVSSLLEVGTGFHPELTGRENVYLNGAIFGMGRKEIEKKFNEIVEFSGVKEFIDMPVKRYSSGMQVRLAFSVAANLDSDILVIDEVLAVGDAEFQKKCLGKMDEVTKDSGRTIFFVSHDMGAIRRICNKVVVLDKGKVLGIGETEVMINKYLMDSSDIVKHKFEKDTNKDINIVGVEIINEEGDCTNNIMYNEAFSLKIDYFVNRKVMGYNANFVLSNINGVRFFTSLSSDDGVLLDSEKGIHSIIFQMSKSQGIYLNPGKYSIYIGIGSAKTWDMTNVNNVFLNVIEKDKKSGDIRKWRVQDSILVDGKWIAD